MPVGGCHGICAPAAGAGGSIPPAIERSPVNGAEKRAWPALARFNGRRYVAEELHFPASSHLDARRSVTEVRALGHDLAPRGQPARRLPGRQRLAHAAAPPRSAQRGAGAGVARPRAGRRCGRPRWAAPAQRAAWAGWAAARSAPGHRRLRERPETGRGRPLRAAVQHGEERPIATRQQPTDRVRFGDHSRELRRRPHVPQRLGQKGQRAVDIYRVGIQRAAGQQQHMQRRSGNSIGHAA